MRFVTVDRCRLMDGREVTIRTQHEAHDLDSLLDALDGAIPEHEGQPVDEVLETKIEGVDLDG